MIRYAVLQSPFSDYKEIKNSFRQFDAITDLVEEYAREAVVLYENLCSRYTMDVLAREDLATDDKIERVKTLPYSVRKDDYNCRSYKLNIEVSRNLAKNKFYTSINELFFGKRGLSLAEKDEEFIIRFLSKKSVSYLGQLAEELDEEFADFMMEGKTLSNDNCYEVLQNRMEHISSLRGWSTFYMDLVSYNLKNRLLEFMERDVKEEDATKPFINFQTLVKIAVQLNKSIDYMCDYTHLDVCDIGYPLDDEEATEVGIHLTSDMKKKGYYAVGIVESPIIKRILYQYSVLKDHEKKIYLSKIMTYVFCGPDDRKDILPRATQRRKGWYSRYIRMLDERSMNQEYKK